MTGAHIWADRFDGALDDIFQLQDQVASGVVGAIEPELRLTEIERVNSKSPQRLRITADLGCSSFREEPKVRRLFAGGGSQVRTRLGRPERLRPLKARFIAGLMNS